MKSGFKNEKIKQAYEQIPENLKSDFLEIVNDFVKRKRKMFRIFMLAEIALLLLFGLTILTQWGFLLLVLIGVAFLFYNNFYFKMVNLFQDKWEKALNAPPYLDFLHMEEMHERWLKRKQ